MEFKNVKHIKIKLINFVILHCCRPHMFFSLIPNLVSKDISKMSFCVYGNELSFNLFIYSDRKVSGH